jgi:hypothetical protein
LHDAAVEAQLTERVVKASNCFGSMLKLFLFLLAGAAVPPRYKREDKALVQE